MRKEVKIGFALISLLMGVFGFVLYKRIQGRQLEAKQALAAQTANASSDAAPPDQSSTSSTSTPATTTMALRPAAESGSQAKTSSIQKDPWSKPDNGSRQAQPSAASSPPPAQWQTPASSRESGSRLSIASSSPSPVEETARPELSDFADSPHRSVVRKPEAEPEATSVDPISALRPESPPATLSNLPPGGHPGPARDPFAGSGRSEDRYTTAPRPGADLDEPPPAAVDAFRGTSPDGPPPARLAYSDTLPPSPSERPAPVDTTSEPRGPHPSDMRGSLENHAGPTPTAQPNHDPRNRYSSGTFTAASPEPHGDRYAQSAEQFPPASQYEPEPAPVRGSLTGTTNTVVQGRFAGAVDQASAAGYTNPGANTAARPAEPQDRWQPNRNNVLEPKQQPYYDDRAAVPASAVSHAAPAAAPNGQYTVQPGDSFWVISRKLYGDGSFFKALTEHNRREYPQSRNLQVGDVVSAPAAEDLRQAYPDLCPKLRQPLAGVHRPASAQKLAGTRIYVVEDGDTLFDIARHELGSPARWVEIYELNADRLSNDFDYIRQGTELILPGTGAPRARETVTGRPNAAPPR